MTTVLLGQKCQFFLKMKLILYQQEVGHLPCTNFPSKKATIRTKKSLNRVLIHIITLYEIYFDSRTIFQSYLVISENNILFCYFHPHCVKYFRIQGFSLIRIIFDFVLIMQSTGIFYTLLRYTEIKTTKFPPKALWKQKKILLF